MVRLLRLLLKSAREEHPSFNPTMVRLLHGKEYVVFLPVWGFNPTMVRLLQWCGRHVKAYRIWFQSHYGAIATRLGA